MRSLCALGLLLILRTAGAATPLVVYDDALRNGFNDRSWTTTYSLANTSPVHAGTKSISFTASNFEGLQFVADNVEFNLADYQSATFWVNGGSAGSQSLTLYVSDNYAAVGDTYDVATLISGGAIPKNSWKQVTLDFDTAGLTFGTFNGIVIQDSTGGAGQPVLYVDDIEFTPRTSPPPSGGIVNVTVDIASNVHPFSQQIFGVAFGDATRNGQMGYTVDRWGGNSTTRYNWQVDTDNKASDYLFLNEPEGSGAGLPNNSTADQFVNGAMTAGAQPLIAIPTIGWTPKDRAKRPGFSIAKYGPQHNNECTINPFDGCDADAGDGTCDTTSNTTGHCNGGVITGNDATDTSASAPSTFEAQWIGHFQSVFGTAANGGVKMYSLDNEVMLWNSTHRDVHPSPTTYDETWNKAVDYASAIKQKDPNALVTGPVTYGYCDLFGSAADDCLLGDDRTAHGGLPFVAWYLQQVCTYQTQHGIRLIDYLDLHYYPGDPNSFDPNYVNGNSIYSNADDSATVGRRLRSLRELWDPTWVAESWIQDLDDDPTYHYDKPDLIPRVRAWIDQYCPGTKLAITEYAWDRDMTDDGAVAQAEALAIFAREGVDLATRWTAPATGSKAERGFEIFRNYDGSGSKVQGDSVSATTSNIDQVGAYAFHGNGNTMVLLTNKDTVSHDVVVTFTAARNATWNLYGFDPSNAQHLIHSDVVNGSIVTLSGLLPMSASLLVVPDIDEIFKNGFD